MTELQYLPASAPFYIIVRLLCYFEQKGFRAFTLTVKMAYCHLHVCLYACNTAAHHWTDLREISYRVLLRKKIFYVTRILVEIAQRCRTLCMKIWVLSCCLIAVENILLLDSSPERIRCYNSMANLDGFMLLTWCYVSLARMGKAEAPKCYVIRSLSGCVSIFRDETLPFAFRAIMLSF